MSDVTNLPNGLKVYGMPVMPGNPLIPPTTGKFFFVNSGVGLDTNLGTNPAFPLATIAAAIALCTDSKGDVIIVMAGHAESISGAAAIAVNKIGITIVGLGNSTLRPTITLHTTATTIAISAANVTLRNLRIKTDVDAVVKVFNITAAGVTLDAVDFVETAACAALQFILTTAAAVDLTVMNCSWIQTQTAATSTQEWIRLVGADRFRCINNFANLKGAVSTAVNGVIVGATTACNDVFIEGNRFISTNSTAAIVISLLAATTGMVVNNFVASIKTAIVGQVAIASCYGGNNYANNTVNVSGLLDPVVDA